MRDCFWLISYTHPNSSGEKTKYIGSSRKELFRSTDCLHDICQPKFDEEMKKKSEEINKSIENLRVAKPKDKIINVNEFYDKVKKQVLKRYRELFQQLCFFLDRQNWFKGEKVED